MMADDFRRCEYKVYRQVKCGRLVDRISNGKHYCIVHFQAIISPAKDEVVEFSNQVHIVVANSGYTRVLDDCVRQLCGAMTRLKALGWLAVEPVGLTEKRRRCHMCGRGVDMDTYCYGCKVHICSMCDAPLDERPFGFVHPPEMHAQAS